MKLLLPTQYVGPAPTFDAMGEAVEVIAYDASGTIPTEHRDAEFLVVWGQGPDLLDDAAKHMTNLRLIQALMAGPDEVVAAGFSGDVPIATGVGLHDGPVTEHALALTLALLRELPHLFRQQREHVWDERLSGPQSLRAEDGRMQSLIGARVVIWGFGSIGQTLAPVLGALGAEVTGVARSAGERAGFRTVTEDEFPALLPRTDILIMVLPKADSTVKALNASVIDRLPDSALLVNVGRGSTVDEADLLTALREGRLAGAALDVTETEPLPEDSLLWDAPNTIITPHSAGGRPVGADELIESNVRAVLAGEAIRNEVER